MTRRGDRLGGTCHSLTHAVSNGDSHEKILKDVDVVAGSEGFLSAGVGEGCPAATTIVCKCGLISKSLMIARIRGNF